jgi:hypothetical protein
MAMQNRYQRRILGEIVQDVIETAMKLNIKLKQDRYARMIFGMGDPKLAYVFLVLAYPFHCQAEGEVTLSYEQYRQLRTMILEAYCRAVLYTRRSLNTVVAIGMGPHSSQTADEFGSVSFFTMHIDEWTPELEAEALEAMEVYDILREERLNQQKLTDEWPIVEEEGRAPWLINFSSSRSRHKKPKK